MRDMRCLLGVTVLALALGAVPADAGSYQGCKEPAVFTNPQVGSLSAGGQAEYTQWIYTPTGSYMLLADGSSVAMVVRLIDFGAQTCAVVCQAVAAPGVSGIARCDVPAGMYDIRLRPVPAGTSATYVLTAMCDYDLSVTLPC
ncbi:MAG: hypothetical protein LC624_00170 [Halobacteriales archaeon]|nr:hypothetical protein [Halobacteriales archaeon]